MGNLTYIFIMLKKNRAKYNKRISSIILGTYSALLIVISFHFHSIFTDHPAILTEQKSAAADFSGDTIYSGGNFCQFLLNYKTNLDPAGIEAPDLKLILTGETINPSEQKEWYSHAANSINLRAPPSAPFFV